jgi:tetratricopeptide (TPR) repeat protein
MLALIGTSYEEADEPDQARRFAAAALRKDDCCARAWNLRGMIAYRRSNFKSAARHFRKATDCDPSWGDPWTNLGTIFWEQKAQDEALGYLRKGFQLSPTAPNVAAAYHIAISETGQFAKARCVFEEVVQRYPDFRKARFFLIDILVKLEAYQAALTHIEAAVVRFGSDTQFLSAAAAVREKIGALTIKAQNHHTLSLCMIVKNEEKQIARCLHSLKPLVDELIVVDTGSTDHTRMLAQIFGARVYDYAWSDDFAAARNYSIDQANGRWILIMDADEVISPKDHQQMKKIIRRHRDSDTAFSVTTRNYTPLCNLLDWTANEGAYPEEEIGTGWTPSEKVRLFPNRPDIRFDYPVHEVVRPSLDREGITILKCPIPVHHYGHLSPSETARKGEVYFQIGIDKLHKMEQDPIAIQELAIQAGMLGRPEVAVELWRKFLVLKPDEARAYINLSTAYDQLGQHSDSRRAARRSVELHKGLKEGPFNAARADLHLGRAAEAAAQLKPLVLKYRDYFAAQFMLGCARICADEMQEGLTIIAKLKSTSLWPTIDYSFEEIAQSLLNAGQDSYRAQICQAASRLKRSTTPSPQTGELSLRAL